jgi:hypothetical protein
MRSVSKVGHMFAAGVQHGGDLRLRRHTFIHSYMVEAQQQPAAHLLIRRVMTAVVGK